MGNFGDALKKAGILSEKEHRQQKHQERVHRSQVGREGLADEARRVEDERRARAAETVEHTKNVEARRQAATGAADAKARAKDLVRGRNYGDAIRGNRRWHYVTHDGRIPWMLVNDDAARHLESGEYAIVEGGLVVHRAVAIEARTLDPRIVLFLNE